jgi:hypothetical protein
LGARSGRRLDLTILDISTVAEERRIVLELQPPLCRAGQ